MTKDEKIELKKKFPLRWVAELAISTGFSKVYIRKVMSGEASNVMIEKKALELALKYQEDINEVEHLKNTIL